MSEIPDMDEPVTRRELHEALDTWSGAIVARTAAHTASMIAESEQRLLAVIAGSETRVLGELQRIVGASEQRLIDELRGHTRSSETELATRLVAVDQHYNDLPARVSRLEAKVFAPKPRRRARRSR